MHTLCLLQLNAAFFGVSLRFNVNNLPNEWCWYCWFQFFANGIIVFMRYAPHMGNGSLSWDLSSNTSYSLEISTQLFGIAKSALELAH